MSRTLLETLTQTYGPSGNEKAVRDIIIKELDGVVDEMKVDVMGNLIATKKGREAGKKIMISAHMDEIGIMVTHIDDNGYLRFTAIGGVSPSTALYQRVVFANGVKGLVGVEKLESLKDLELKKLFIDIGSKDKADTEKMISIGDVAIFTSGFEHDGSYIVSKALDDRIGCYIAIEAAKQLGKTDNEAVFVFSTQEEVGIRGAKTAAYGIDADLAFAVDVTMTGDTPGCDTMAVKLNGGAAIKVRDSSIVVSPAVKNLMVETAIENSIPYQMEVLLQGGTDGGAIHTTRAGIPTGVISIPCRYLHTPAEMVSASDVIACTKLLVKLLEK